jgi:DEAD/DEAH box helicase domain-containing protein
MHTTAVWWRIDEAALERCFESRCAALDGFLGAAYALHTVAVLRAMAEPRDLGKAVGSGAGEWNAVVDARGRGQLRDDSDRELSPDALARFAPTVFLYDNYPGGTGFSEPLFGQRRQLVADALRLVAECDCTHGCPACIGPVLASDEQGARVPKALALQVLRLLDGEAVDADAAVVLDVRSIAAGRRRADPVIEGPDDG